MLKLSTVKITLLIGILLLFFCINLHAQKPVLKQQLEITPQEKKAFYHYINKRVSKEDGTPRALYQVNYAVQPDTPEAMARQYLRENSRLLTIRDAAVDLRHIVTRETPGGFHVRFQQQLNGYPVYRGEIVVNLNRKHQVTFVMNGYQPQAKLTSLAFKTSPDDAENIAKNYLGIRQKPLYENRETVVYHANGETRLAHQIKISTIEVPRGEWEILVDAQTGEIFKAVDHTLFHNSSKSNGDKTTATGTGWVFDPDPLSRSGEFYQANGQFGDNNDADSDSLTAQLIETALNDITFRESDSLYLLDGTYAEILDWDQPFKGEFSQPSDTFHFTRNDDAFEAVNVYYHIDKSMRYINETLGFELMPYQYIGGVKADPHGWNGQDQSSYAIFRGRLTFGEGGVDDAEDVDVILHELGHGLHDWLTNGGLSQVNGLSEGCGDYWAQSYSRSTGFWQPGEPQYNWVFHWDGHNQFWSGRRTDYTAQYPQGLVNQIHTDGQMWASTLMSIWNEIGRTATDRNFLECLAMTSSSTNQEDAAQAFIQADLNLYGGAHLGVIQFWFEQRGYNITVPAPTITHIPLTDNEDLNGPYVVNAEVSATAAVAEVKLFYGTDSVFSDTLDMVWNDSVYTAAIPGMGNNARFNYYIFAADSNGLAATDPPNAPQDFYAFAVEVDTVLPTIQHFSLGNQAFRVWPASVSATITDNIGIASAHVEYTIGDNGASGSFDLIHTGGDLYFGSFDIDTTALAIGDTISYRIIAEDASALANRAISPAEGFHRFAIVDAAGVILIVNDDTLAVKHSNVTEKGRFSRDYNKNQIGASAAMMQDYLESIGFLTVVEDIQFTNPNTWEQYDLIISSSGYNDSPVADSLYRQALIQWVSNPAHKLLIEGGEVGYDATTAPHYPDFAANVLHSNAWEDDNGGPLRLMAGRENHPMVTTPHELPDRMFIVFSEWPSQDMVNTINGAYTLYDTQNKAGYAGISIYDDNLHPGSAQIAFYAFNYAEMFDSTNARNLLENTVEYLLAPENILNSPPSDFNLISPINGDSLAMADTIQFTWNTATDVDNDTLDYTLHIFSRSSNIRVENIQDTTFQFIGNDLTPETIYQWTMEANDGELATASSDTFSFVTPPVVGIADIPNGLPAEFALYQNYPNPFNPTTAIRYDLSNSSTVSLKIFNVLGQEVRTLVNEKQSAGFKTVAWDARDNFGNPLASGIYVYKLEASASRQNFVQTRKMILLR